MLSFPHFPGSSEIARFLISGGINTLVTYSIYLLLNQWTSYIIAYSIAYIIGIVVSYLVNAGWVFKKTFNLKSFIFYPLVYLSQYILGITLLYLLVNFVNIHQSLAPLIVVSATLPVTFLMSKAILNFGSTRST